MAVRSGCMPCKWCLSHTPWLCSQEGKELGLSPASSDDEVLAAIEEHPQLLERPIFLLTGSKEGSKAVVGRPPQNVLDLLAEADLLDDEDDDA